MSMLENVTRKIRMKKEKKRIEERHKIQEERDREERTQEAVPYEVYVAPTVSEVPNTSSKPNTVVQAPTNAKGTKGYNAPVVYDDKGKPIYPYEKQPYVYVPKPTEKSLTIILVEDTAEMKEYEAVLTELYQRCKTDFLFIIHYWEKVRIEGIEIHKFFKKNNDEEVKSFKISEDAGDKACFADAVSETVKIVSENFNKIKEKNFSKTKITKINIIGIGTCKDNCSNSPREKAIEDFSKMLNTTNIPSKYLCLTEEFFFEAAEYGFRSIGSISEDY